MLVATLFVAVILGGCASLPLPASHDQSLVIFALNNEFNRSDREIRSVVVDVRNLDSGRSYRQTVSPGSTYAAFALPPGRYHLVSVLVVHQHEHNSSTDTQRRELRRSFYVGEFTVVLVEQIRIINNSRGDWPQIEHGFASPAVRSSLADTITNDRRWAAWETARRINLQ